MRDENAGPDKPPTPEDLKSEKLQGLRDQHKDMVRKALDRIMTIMTSQQRQQVEKWWSSRPQPGGGPAVKKFGAPQAEPGAKGYGGNI